MDTSTLDNATTSARLSEATAAAENAYRDTARLIRLLTVLSSPAAPAELLGRSLAVLSEVFASDIVSVVEAVGDRYVVTAASGIPEDDPSFVEGWVLGPAAREATSTGRAVAGLVESPDEDVPSGLARLRLRSFAVVPMSSDSVEIDELLLLYRSSGEPFSGTDLHILASVAKRLSAAAADRERAVAIERLAQTGHLLARHLDPASLNRTASDLLRRLTMSDSAWVVLVSDGLGGRWNRNNPPPRPGDDGWPVIDPLTWEAALQGRVWTRAVASGSGPHATMCVPVMRAGVPVALLYAVRDRPRPYRVEIREIATIFASYFGAALQNSRLYHELRRQATRDPLTGLGNRDEAVQRLDTALTTSSAAHCGLLFCDLDGFKAVNDRLGHEAGDELLQLVAMRLRDGIRPRDLLARFGGDEFVVVLEEVRDLDEVVQVGRRLVRGFDQPFTLHGERVSVTASVGGVLGRPGQTTAGTMLRDADAAMYVAKARGPGGVEAFDEAASYRSLDRLGLRSELSRALDRGEFEVRYQPIVRLESGDLVAYEALLRWTHPCRGPVPPSVFIPLAEETGDIVRIGTWVLKQACGQLGRWQRLPDWRHLAVSVNVSAAQLWQDAACEHIVGLMRSVGVDPSDVWLEVTERSHAGEDVTTVTQSLRSKGVHLALDDFGASYSNLAYLKQFPAESLKIDRSFVHNVASDSTNRRIVRGILAIADSLGMVVVAEGVERAVDRDALLALGCRFGQGHLFAPALPVSEATELLHEASDPTGAGRTPIDRWRRHSEDRSPEVVAPRS